MPVAQTKTALACASRSEGLPTERVGQGDHGAVAVCGEEVRGERKSPVASLQPTV